MSWLLPSSVRVTERAEVPVTGVDKRACEFIGCGEGVSKRERTLLKD